MSRLIGKFPEKCQFSKKDSLDGCIFPCLLVSSGFPDGPSQVFSCKFKASGGRLTIASVGVLWEADSKRDKVVMHLQGATPVRENGRKPGKAGRALRLQFMSDPSEGEREREKKGVEASWSTYSLRWAEWGLWAASSQVSCQLMTWVGCHCLGAAMGGWPPCKCEGGVQKSEVAPWKIMCPWVECLKVYSNDHQSNGGVLGSGRSKYEFYLALPFPSCVVKSKFLFHPWAQFPHLENVSSISSVAHGKAQMRV